MFYVIVKIVTWIEIWKETHLSNFCRHFRKREKIYRYMAQLFWKYRKFFGKFFPWFFFLFTCLNFPWRNLWIRKIDKDDAEMLRSVSFLLTSDRPLYWSKLTFYNCFQAIWSQMPRQSSKNSAFKSVNWVWFLGAEMKVPYSLKWASDSGGEYVSTEKQWEIRS